MTGSCTASASGEFTRSVLMTAGVKAYEKERKEHREQKRQGLFLPSRIKCQERMFTFLQLQLQLQALQTLQAPGKENVTEGLKGEVP